MSELGDKERRFVEDQRRIASQPNAGPAAADTVRYVYEPTVTVRSQSIKNFQSIKNLVEEIDRKDALLVAEAAEVLREFREIDPTFPSELGMRVCVCCRGVLEHLRECPWIRAKPLLDKLGERESK